MCLPRASRSSSPSFLTRLLRWAPSSCQNHNQPPPCPFSLPAARTVPPEHLRERRRVSKNLSIKIQSPRDYFQEQQRPHHRLSSVRNSVRIVMHPQSRPSSMRVPSIQSMRQHYHASAPRPESRSESVARRVSTLKTCYASPLHLAT